MTKPSFDPDLSYYGTALVVDDEPTTRKIVARYLQKMNVNIVHAESGLAAVLKAFSEHIDFIMLDLQLPLLSGFEVIARLREDGFSRPIIAMSATSDEAVRDKCLAASFDGFIAKPFTRAYFDSFFADYAALVATRATTAPEYQDDLHDSLREVVREFALRLGERTEKIQSARDSGDWEIVLQEVHKLRAAGLFGFVSISRLAGLVEDRIRKGEPDESVADLDSLIKVCNRIGKRYLQGKE